MNLPPPGRAALGSPKCIARLRCTTTPVSKRSLVPRQLIRLRVPLGFLFAAWYLFVALPASREAYLTCLVLVVFGCLLRSWAAGYLLKVKRVAVGGPYAFIR